MKTAIECAKYLAEQSIKVAEIAADLDDKAPGSVMQKALILRSEIMMDCAKMVKKWSEKIIR